MSKDHNSGEGRVYVADHTEPVLRTHGARTAANSAAYLLPYLKADQNVLDVGCGPGTITTDIAKLVPEGRVTGLDFVADPLEGARAFAAGRGVHNITFAVGNVEKLDFPNDSFDVVHAHQVLQHVGDPVQALREMRRVAKPGGIVAARESASLTWYPELPGLGKWLELSERVARAKGGNPHPGRRIHVWAHEAGFDRAAITRTAGSWLFSTPEERAHWSGAFADRALSPSFIDVAVNGGHCTREDLDAVVKAWNEWGAHEDGWMGLLHGEIVCRV